MDLLAEPQIWVSFLTLVMLEIVLGIDNIIFLSVLVERLPKIQRGSARILGLGFAMLTRIALLFSITWLATLRDPLFRALGTDVSGRDLILFAGGLFLIVKAVMELRDMLKGKVRSRKPGVMNSFVMIIIQIGVIDIVFSLDSVFTAVGLAKHIEVMVAAIVISVLVMMVVSAGVSRFIDRYPDDQGIGAGVFGAGRGRADCRVVGAGNPAGYLYFAMAFAAAVEWINIRLRRRIK